ncbi:hypothetical protein PGTUg99_022845 [Puccinia graminis f. sp. tritici]|uniref:Uncharacterized protein n=1 Tax=Puccinia graminis f. sp. tritici TaxID=56615 RepID=A0A5B0R8D3_PUCGR|nr:hypothetical protein PGTUg99_022845 [Puccinia graminis f. sp. tritici]
MANSHEHAISSLIDSFSSLGADDCPQQIRHLEVLVAEELGRVYDRYLALWHGIVSPADPLVIFKQVDIRKQLLDQLHSKRLSSLRRQVDSLTKALLARSALRKKITPVSKLKLVLKILAKLELTMGKIKFAIACISPDLKPAEVRDDQYFENLKWFISRRLAIRIYAVNKHLCALLATYRRLMEQFGHLFAHHEPQKTIDVITLTETCLDSIDEALAFTNKSELNLLQDEWRLTIDSLNETLASFVKFDNWTPPRSPDPADTARRSMGEDPREDEPTPESLLGQPHLLHPAMSHCRISVIAAVKLSRLFVAQLLKISQDTENFQMVPDLSTRELEKFRTMTSTIATSMKNVVSNLSEEPDEARDGIWKQ